MNDKVKCSISGASSGKLLQEQFGENGMFVWLSEKWIVVKTFFQKLLQHFNGTEAVVSYGIHQKPSYTYLGLFLQSSPYVATLDSCRWWDKSSLLVPVNLGNLIGYDGCGWGWGLEFGWVGTGLRGTHSIPAPTIFFLYNLPFQNVFFVNALRKRIE